MTAKTSGTTVFNLPFNEMAEEAYERCGVEMRTGYQLRTARRSLNLLTIEWANKGINLWTIEQGEILLVTGQTTYPIPTDTIDLLDTVIRQNQATSNQIDISITRISETGYITTPNKLAQGRPIQLWVNRQSGEENLTTATLDGDITSSDTTINVSSTTDLASRMMGLCAR
jgi:PIN domain nuclease of toxin-antitoxin system